MASDSQLAALLRPAAEGGRPAGLTRSQIMFLQGTAGNRAVQRFLASDAVTVQRKGLSTSSVKKAVGLGKKESAAKKAGKTGVKAGAAKVVTVADLDKQVSTLASVTRKLVSAHQKGDQAGQKAASEVHTAAQHILGNLPDQKSKASKLLGRTYPEQVRQLKWVINETQLILDEVRVENTRGEAQDIYMAAGRPETKGQQGALTKLTARSIFETKRDQPAPNAEVLAYLKEHGFAHYEQAFDDVLAKSAADPRSQDERKLHGLQPELFSYTERSRSRAAAQRMGLSVAELAAIQVYSAQDYRYINPATANDAGWLKANHPDLADKDDKTLDEWGELQDQLAAEGQTLDQRMADRRREFTTLREEGGLHTGMAMGGLRKMPVWRGTAYRGQRMDRKRCYPQFVRDADGFRPRNPTFTWKTITSISKSESSARAFSTMREGPYIVLFEFEVNNGRDIEALSVNRKEQEVALLPGAEFAYGAIEVIRAGKYVEGMGDTPWQLRIKAKQTK